MIRIGRDTLSVVLEIEGRDRMKAVIVYESMFGNTRAIAGAIAEGLGAMCDTEVVGVAEAERRTIDDADLLVVGGPTHAWGMSRPSTRKGAPSYASKPGSDLVLEPGADSGPGVREWMASLGRVDGRAAAFDTRLRAPAALTGRASKGIGKELSEHGLELVMSPQSFFVTKKNHLLAGESERARAWGAQLATMIESSGISQV